MIPPETAKSVSGKLFTASKHDASSRGHLKAVGAVPHGADGRAPRGSTQQRMRAMPATGTACTRNSRRLARVAARRGTLCWTTSLATRRGPRRRRVRHPRVTCHRQASPILMQLVCSACKISTVTFCQCLSHGLEHMVCCRFKI
jgi:hypothetical protein